MMNRRVFLIFPQIDAESPFKMAQPLLVPLGLLYLAAFLEKHEYEVKILDNSIEGLQIENVIERVKKFDPFLVGVSCYSSTYNNSLKILSRLKNIGILTIVGGPHATVLPENFNFPYVDFICKSEGELTLYELCESIQGKKDISKILGLYRRVNNGLIFNGDRNFIEDLDIIPHPDRSKLPIDSYSNKVPNNEINAYPVFGVNTSRGCPFYCTYCSVSSIWGKRYRSFSIDWIMKEIRELINYGAKGIYFYEDNFTFDKKRVRLICENFIKEDFKIIWACEGRIGSVDFDDLRLMKKAGCQSIKFGIETGSVPLLKKIKKNIDLERIKETRELCKKAGINFICFILYGIPGETEEDLRDTITLLKEIQPDSIISNHFKIVPGSDLYNNELIQGYSNKDAAGFLYKKELEKNYSWFLENIKKCIR